MKVREAMTSPVVTVRPETTFKETAELLLDHDITGVPVVTDDGRLAGIVTEADLMSKEAFGTRYRKPLGAVLDTLRGEQKWMAKSAGLTAGAVMTKNVLVARPDDDTRDAVRMMLDHKVKRLPVVEDGKIVGIISRHDVLRCFHRTDRDLAGELQAKLASPLHAPDDHHATVDVEDGIVILSGHVLHQSDVAVLEGMCWRTPGVVGVVSHLSEERPEAW